MKRAGNVIIALVAIFVALGARECWAPLDTLRPQPTSARP